VLFLLLLLTTGPAAIADAISNMEAISLVNVMGNSIGKEQLSKLQEIMHSKPNLMSLCGIVDDATEADLSGLGMDGDDAIILASELPDKRALTHLHVGENNIPEKQMREIIAIVMHMDSMKILCQVPFKDKTLTELDVSGKNLGTEGAFVVADYICNNGALSCKDGRYYHEWEANGSPFKNSYTVTWGGGLGIRKEPTQGAENIGKVSAGTTVEGLNEDGDWLQIQHEGLVGWTVLRDGDGENYTPKKQHFKYISSAPDVHGQDDDPSVPISNGMCQRCGNPKGKHTAKGALTSLNLSSNRRGVVLHPTHRLALLKVGGAKIVAEAIKVTVQLRSFWHHFHAHLAAG
jgi:hypothetical protein